MKLIHKGKLGEEDLQQCVMAIRKNAVECMQGVLRAMETFKISLGLSENVPCKEVRTYVRTYVSKHVRTVLVNPFNVPIFRFSETIFPKTELKIKGKYPVVTGKDRIPLLV